uniref:ATP synthase subunit a n=1 Tax=Pyramidella dolabrata TaxID=252582 RepID=B3DFG3_9GAST|nr:ATP synthase F0 subunit 6 [Pyramidella dolabrata]ACE62850.1 ATP synthase F0 subunit 6 [Pyramidella dolabrata]
MHTDLFSSLDGCNSVWSWAVLMLFLFVFSNKAWKLQASTVFFSKVSAFSGKNDNLNPMNLMTLSLMLMLILLNLSGLLPFVYSFTSSLWFASSLGLALWGFLIVSGWVYSPKKSSAHLAPAGAPAVLIPFLVLIETVSLLIRPLTLTIRLVANISAGHIVLGLVANVLCSSGLLGLSLLLPISVGYFMFEVFVSFIQAYIFTLLIGLYSHEHP